MLIHMGWLTVAGADTNDLAVNSAGDAVLDYT